MNSFMLPNAHPAKIRSLQYLLMAGIISFVAYCPASAGAQTLQIATPAPVAISPPAATARGGSDAAVQEMRQAAGNDDIEALAQAIQKLEALNPSYPSLSVYRSILENKRNSLNTSGTVAGATASRVVTPRPTPRRTPEPTPVVTAETKPAPPPPSSYRSTDSAWTRYLIPAAIAVAVLMLLAMAVKMFRRKKTTATATATAAMAPPAPLPPPIDLLFDPSKNDALEQTVIPPTVDEKPLVEDVAQQFAFNVLPSSGAITPPPAFDIPDDVPSETSRTPSSFDDLPTVIETPGMIDEQKPQGGQQSAPLSSVPQADDNDFVSFQALGLHPHGTEHEDVSSSQPPRLNSIDLPSEPEDFSSARDETIAISPDNMMGSITLDDIFETQNETSDKPPQPVPSDRDQSASGIPTMNLGDDEMSETIPFNASTPPPTTTPLAPLDEETLHGMDTLMINPPETPDSSPALDETIPFDMPAAVEPPPMPAGDNFYHSGGAPGTPDERSEKMFREQLDKGLKAVGDRDWRQAVHYLSIAAAIHPEDEAVRNHLRNARDEKKRSEGAG